MPAKEISMVPGLVGLCLAATVGLYFYNNPLRHGRWFMLRRFINWFPLGMTYAFLYMGRYNLNVAKNALGGMMTKEDFGIIFAAGTWTYALSFLVNGPLIDRKLGGKRGIIIAAIGASIANAVLGLLTYLTLTHRLKANMVLAFSAVYAVNMYFQSYGAVSIIKVKSYWFHVRERGVFGAIFGTLISFGVYFAFDWGQAIVKMAEANPTGQMSWLHRTIQNVFALNGQSVDAVWAVFYIPAMILIAWALLDTWLIKDYPEEAGFAHFDTHDASSGQMHVEFTTLDLLKKVFASRLMLLLALAELTSGVLRNGIYQWYPIFAKEIPQRGAKIFGEHWGLLLCISGIIGGFAGGLISDKMFQSRRGPPVALLCGFMFIMTIIMSFTLLESPFLLGCAAIGIAMAVIGVTSLISGTAATDFGGRKATGTCSGIIDGCAYLGTGLQSISLGYLTSRNWIWWPVFLAPFALLGMVIAIRIWNELPAATRKYIAEVENAKAPVAQPELVA
jgi:OPA family glycerol-3-phosphate transporter-like MFS transporter